MLTTEQWNALTDEDKLSRADEKPQDGSQQSDTEKLQVQLTDSQNQLKEAKELLESAHREKSGIYHDLKGKEGAMKDLKDKIAELETRITNAATGDDDTYLTSNKAKTMVEAVSKEVKDELTKLRSEAMQDRELRDEDRMKTRTDLKISYNEAVKSFVKLCKDNPSYYQQVQAEAARVGGKPAEMAYKLAITNDPDFIKRIEQDTRETLMKDLEKGGKHRKLPTGGAGGGTPDYAGMSMEEISKLSPETLEKLSRGELT